MKLILIHLLLLLLTLFNFLLLVLTTNEFVCRKDIEIRNTVDQFHSLSNCTRVEGYVRIGVLENYNSSVLDGLSFPKLIEITDYLLIFRILEVKSLEKWFPNLQYIRGRKLFYGYALVVNDLKDLRRLGFNKLQHIRGGVRIEYTERLCFAHTLDYETIATAVQTSHPTNGQKWTQLVPGFAVTPRTHDIISIKWNYTSMVNNQTINNLFIKIFEFEDSSNSKLFGLNYCSPSDSELINQALVMPQINDYTVCKADKTNRFNQTFIFSTDEQEIDSKNNFLAKIQRIFFRTKEEKSELKDLDSINLMSMSPIYHIKSNSSIPVPEQDKKPPIEAYKLENLTHFTPYIVKLIACTNRTHCFTVAKAKTKTLPLERADYIDESSVNYTIENNSITIKWNEPERPNGAIRSFEIQILDEINNTYRNICLNRWEYKINNNSITINITDLELDVRYGFKIRTISLARKSKWTSLHYFTISGDSIEVPEGLSIVYLTVGITLLLIAFVLTAIMCYLKAPKKKPNSISIISANPEYENADPMWEINKKDIKLLHVLGDGAFGRVYYGELRINNKLTKCAVKMLNTSPQNQRNNFLKEANIMKSFVECHHIVKLIGIVSIENPVLVLMEYMVNGDLKTYLRHNRLDSEENPNPLVPTFNRMLQMAIEISDGMLYLSSRKFVHRDLAARNCMVAEDLTVKIGDFGMARDVYDNDYYRKNDCGLIPVRWMSPESLKDGVFTTYSDIWSYGVVLWEIITLGAQPYQGMSNESVFQGVIRGLRLKEPDDCPKKLWRIMQFCWRKYPKSRPSFMEISEYLLPSANQSFRENCYYLKRKPLVKRHESMKKFLYSFIPTNRLLLNDIKPSPEYIVDEDIQYCPMKATVDQRTDELNEEEVKLLNRLNQINTKPKIDKMIEKCLPNIIEKSESNEYLNDRKEILIQASNEWQNKIQIS